jgi:hypothetical protein
MPFRDIHTFRSTRQIHQVAVLQIAKLTNPLTNTEVKQAKPKDKLNDGGGLLLRVKPNSFETWIFDY